MLFNTKDQCPVFLFSTWHIFEDSGPSSVVCCVEHCSVLDIGVSSIDLENEKMMVLSMKDILEKVHLGYNSIQVHLGVSSLLTTQSYASLLLKYVV